MDRLSERYDQRRPLRNVKDMLPSRGLGDKVGKPRGASGAVLMIQKSHTHTIAYDAPGRSVFKLETFIQRANCAVGSLIHMVVRMAVLSSMNE